MTTSPDPLDRLQTALDGLADALVAGDAAAVLAMEPILAEATMALRVAGRPDIDSGRHELRLRLLRARLTIERCRRLGAAIGEVAAAMQPATVYSNHRHQPSHVRSSR